MPVKTPITQQKRRWFHQHPKKTLVLLLLVLLVFLDFGLTVGVRLVLKGTIAKRSAPNPDNIAVQHPVYHHSLKPNSFSLKTQWGPYTYSTYVNSIGFRDKEIRTVPPSTEKYRIVFMGDSFTQGVGVDFDDTFVGMVFERFVPQNVDVLNAGLSSYSPAIYYVKTDYMLNELELHFDHMVICIDISDIRNDLEEYEIQNSGNKPLIREPFSHKFRRVIHDYTTIGRLILHHSRKGLRTQREKDLAIGDSKSLWTIRQDLFREYGKAGLEKSEQHMNLLYQLLSEKGIGITLVVYPWPDQIFHHDLDSIQVRFWQEWANAHDVYFINLFPAFIKEGESTKSAENTIKTYFFAGDVHWNKEGHALVAQNIIQRLEQFGISPLRQ